MPETLMDLGSYQVLFDGGFFLNIFTLDQSTLDGPDALDGSIAYFDVTDYVSQVQIRRGRASHRDRLEAGTCTVRIRDLNGDFSVVNQNSPYWNPDRNRLGFEPTKLLRIVRDNELLFFGRMTEYRQELTLDGQSYVTVRASDDLQRLNNVLIGEHVPTVEWSGDRLTNILNRPEVNLFTRVGERAISQGKAILGPYLVAAATTVKDYFDKVQTAEQGRIFIGRSGQFIAQPRAGREQLGTPVQFSDQGDGGIEYESFSVEY